MYFCTGGFRLAGFGRIKVVGVGEHATEEYKKGSLLPLVPATAANTDITR